MFERLRGRGMREKILGAPGQGDLYDSLRQAQDQFGAREVILGDARQATQGAAALEAQIIALEEQATALRAKLDQLLHDSDTLGLANAELASARAKLVHFEGLKGADRLIELDFPVRPRVRAGWGQPSWPALQALLEASEPRFADRLRAMLPLVETLSRIPTHTDDPSAPHWVNDWFPAFDALSLYAMLQERNGATFLEIGSGTSTKFARRAIQGHGLRTRIVSIDPFPRSEVDAICDEVVRSGLEDADLGLFERLQPGDTVFFDGSHRSFQNSDVTVFFLEILPKLPPGVLVGIHDIFLPDDYPPEWLVRHYSEQYLLACWMLAGDRLHVELPVWYCSKTPALHSILAPLWTAPNVQPGNITGGGCFWFTIKG